MSNLTIAKDAHIKFKLSEELQVQRYEIRSRICQVEGALDCNEKCDMDLELDLAQSARQFIFGQESKRVTSEILLYEFLCEVYEDAGNLMADIEALLHS